MRTSSLGPFGRSWAPTSAQCFSEIVSLVTPAALVGLVLLVPLVLLYARRRRRRVEVPDLSLWHEVAAELPSRRGVRPLVPLALVLQAAVLIVLVFALARPERRGAAVSAPV